MNGFSFQSLIWLCLAGIYEDAKECLRYYKVVVTLLTTITLIGTLVFIGVNWLLTRYSIVSINTPQGVEYMHATDTRTTSIVNYLTGHGPFPEAERLSVYRQYVKNRLEEEGLEIPADLFSRDLEGVNSLAIAWYKHKYPRYPRDNETLQKLIDRLFDNAIRPPLERFTPNVNDNLWHLLERVGSPKIRWVEEQDDLPSRMVAYSAGDKQSFYYPVDNTIYIEYAGSVNNLLEEVGHAKQFRSNPFSSYLRMSWSFLTAWIGGQFDTEAAIQVYRLRYQNAGTFEGEAHGPIKDKLIQESGLLQVDQADLK